MRKFCVSAKTGLSCDVVMIRREMKGRGLLCEIAGEFCGVVGLLRVKFQASEGKVDKFLLKSTKKDQILRKLIRILVQ